jgi:hypothetical protein
MGVNHGGLHVFVAEKFLNGADVVAVLKQVGGEGVAEGVRGNVFVDFCGLGSSANGFLEEGGVGVVTAVALTPGHFAKHPLGAPRGRGETLTPGPFAKHPFGAPRGRGESGVAGELGGGEEVLPGEFTGGVGVFDGEGVGEVDFAESVCEVGLVDTLDDLDLGLEGRDEGIREDGDAVVFAFAIADDDGVVTKVYVFDAQAQAFHQAQAGAVEELGHEFGDAGHVVDDSEGFGMGEDGREGARFFSADNVGGEFDFLLEDMAVEEEESGESLILCGGGDVLFDGEVGEEGLDFWGAHVFGVTFVMEEDVAFDPVAVGLFGAVGVVFEAQGVGDLVEEFSRGFLFHKVLTLFWGVFIMRLRLF